MKKILSFIMLVFMFGIPFIEVNAISSIEFEQYGFNDLPIRQQCLLNKNGVERYKLYIFENKSYIIYDTFTNKPAEYSTLENSIPFSCEENVFYFGLNKYYTLENKSFKSLLDNHFIPMDKVEDPLVSNSLARSNFNYKYIVPNGQYFKLLDGYKNDFPNNTNGDCGYVAETILLSYYSIFYNNQIICDHYMTAPVNNSSTEIMEWNHVPCATDQFKEEVLKAHVQNPATYPQTIHENIENYLKQTFQKSYDYASFSLLVNKTNTISIIASGFPVLIFGNFSTSDSTNTTGNHVVLAYGYTQNKEVIAHLGYNGRSEVIVGFDYIFETQGGTVHLKNIDQLGHSHGGYTKVNNAYYCAYEKQIVTPNSLLAYQFYDENRHTERCTCGKETLLTHNFFDETMTINKKKIKVKKCSKCGYYIPYVGLSGGML